MIELYEFALSGHCHKVRLMLSMLKLPYQSMLLNGAAGEHKSTDFLAMNPLGQVPVLKDDDTIVRDSHGILVYLAKRYGGTYWWPDTAETLGYIAAWLSTAANEITQGPNALRLRQKFAIDIDVERAMRTTDHILGVINTHLETHTWLVEDKPSIADIAIYPYVALSPEGGVDLSGYSHIQRWFKDFVALPGYIGMPGISGL